MQYDGSVWINTEMDSDGIVKGFERIKDGAGDVAVTVKRVGNVIDKAFSVAGDSSAVTTACRKLEDLARSYADVGNQLEAEKKKLAILKEDFEYLSNVLDPLSDSGPKGFDLDLDTYLEYTEALKALPQEIEKQQAVVDRLEKQWQKSSEAIENSVRKVTQTVNQELERQAETAERTAERIENAATRETAANRRVEASSMNAGTGAVAEEFDRASTAANNFGNRLGKLAAAAFVFDIIRRGLRGVVSYFGSALMANNKFANAVRKLEGSLMTAFQPIYEAVLPALIKLIEWLNYAVQAIGRFYAAMAGKDYNEMRKNAASLNSTISGTGNTMEDAAESTDKAGESIEDIGDKAKEARRSLAGFDEITRLLKDDSEDLSNSLDDLNKGDSYEIPEINNSQPIFEEFKLPDEWGAAIDKLAMRIRDIFFEWEDLTPEVMAEKLVTALTTLAGGVIGFALGGFKGALIGMTAGAILGVLLSGIIFDGDGTLSKEEILKSIIAALSMIAGGILGFSMAGVLGAGIGITAGAVLTVILSNLIFDGDGTISKEEILKSIIAALSIIAGGVIGFVAGGPMGAAVGITLGAGLSFVLESATFNDDGRIGSGEIIKSMVSCIDLIAGTAIGAVVGGPGGAAIGFIVSAGLSVLLTKFTFDENGNISADAIMEALLEVLLVAAGVGLGFVAGGPGGAAMGLLISLTIVFSSKSITFEGIQNAFEGLRNKMSQWATKAKEDVEDLLIKPTDDGLVNMVKNWKEKLADYSEYFEGRQNFMADRADILLYHPMSEMSATLSRQQVSDTERASNSIVGIMKRLFDDTRTSYTIPTDTEFRNLGNKIAQSISDSSTKIKQSWSSVTSWFVEEVAKPIKEAVEDLAKSVADGLMTTLQNITTAIKNAVESAVEAVKRLIASLKELGKQQEEQEESASDSSKSSSGSSSGSSSSDAKTASIASYSHTPEIPQLARGAVIPPNKKFLAVLGDQRHGTNVEAPLATIQEAVAMVMEDFIQSNLAGHEATVAVLQQILEAVLGIELDGETISNAVNSYNRKMAVVKGG